MTAERDIDYETLAQDAMRGLVRTVLTRVAKSGLPGEHHFYIAFKTDADGVSLSKRLKQKYPEEMTVVLQHRFWDLIVSDDRFEVKLTFDGIAERLQVPFAAIKVFFDPSVPYGLQFEESEAASETSTAATPADGQGADADLVSSGGDPGTIRGRAEKKSRAARKSLAEKPADRPSAAGGEKPAAKTPGASEAGAAANDAKVVKLDAFRKK